MNLIEKEVVIRLPGTITIEFSSRNLVQVDKGHTFLSSHLHLPLGVWLTYNLTVLVVGITRCQRHQDGVSALCPHIDNILTQVTAIGVNRLAFAGLFNHHLQRIIAHTGYTGTCTPLVVGTIVVMTNGDDDPVTLADGLFDGLPQLIIERTTTHTTKCLILNGYLFWIKVFVHVVTPAPLTVVTITQRTCTHG